MGTAEADCVYIYCIVGIVSGFGSKTMIPCLTDLQWHNLCANHKCMAHNYNSGHVQSLTKECVRIILSDMKFNAYICAEGGRIRDVRGD